MSTDSLAKSSKDEEHYLNLQYARSVEKDRSFYTLRCIQSAHKFSDIVSASIFHDDVIVDFGGSEGYASRAIARKLFVRPVVMDVNEEDLRKARDEHGLETLCERIDQKTSLGDGSVDWGFCSHVLEHVLDLDACAMELTRVVSRGLYIVVPLENPENFEKADSHMRYSENPDMYLDPFLALGWTIGWRRMPDDERCDFEAWLYR